MSAGASPQTFQRSPRLPSWFQGTALRHKGNGGEGRTNGGKEGKGGEGGSWGNSALVVGG